MKPPGHWLAQLRQFMAANTQAYRQLPARGVVHHCRVLHLLLSEQDLRQPEGQSPKA